MKKKEEITTLGDVFYCNICKEKLSTPISFNMKRIEIIRGLFKAQDFHAHEACVNSLLRKAFEPFLTPSHPEDK